MKKLKEKKQEILTRLKQQSTSKIHWSDDYKNKLKEFSGNGKMIRGSLFLRLYELLGGEKDVLDIAVALEITQSGILAHDDVMDKDDIRRGEKTIHNQYKDFVEDEHFGYSMAICFGDIAFFQSFKLIPDNLKEIYSNQMMNCAFGQMQDLYFSNSAKEPSTQEILEVYKHKTAGYTFSLPMMLAAKLQGEDENKYKELGNLLGIIFQIVDDHIGIFGDKDEIGKTPGLDFKENKKTLHRQIILKRKPELKKYYGKTLTEKELDLLRKEHEQIKPEIDKIITEYQEKADKIIETLNKDQQFFTELSYYNLNRLK